KARIPARRDVYVRRGLLHRPSRLRFPMRSGDDVLRPRRLLRECEDQEYPLRTKHDAAHRPDLRVRGDLRQPGILSIVGRAPWGALAALLRSGEIWRLILDAGFEKISRVRSRRRDLSH